MTNPNPTTPDWMHTAELKPRDYVNVWRVGLLELQFRGIAPARIQIDAGLYIVHEDGEVSVTWKYTDEHLLPFEVAQSVMNQAPVGATNYISVRDAIYTKFQELGLIPPDATSLQETT